MLLVWICITALAGLSNAYQIVPLSLYIVPINYDVELTLSPNNLNYQGEVSILIQTTNIPRDENFLINSEGLNIINILLTENANNEVLVPDFVVNNSIGIANLFIGRPLMQHSQYTLKITFNGIASTDGYGLYRFNDTTGQYLMTNFYPFYARRVFPCFDSPEKKATYSITLITESAYVVSNSQSPSQTEKVGQATRYRFEKTSRIPTHSVFFLVGTRPFLKYGTLPWGNVAISICPSFKKSMFFTDIRKLAYSSFLYNLWNASIMPKLDILVVPQLVEKVYSGYGVVVIRKDLLEFNLNETPTKLKLESTFTLLEGIMNVFFGSIISPKSWEENWLSSSLSKYFKYNAFNSNSSWGNGEEYRLMDFQASVFDSQYPVALKFALTSTESVDKFLKGCSFVKGAAVLSMLETFNSKEEFQQILLNFYSKMNRRANTLDWQGTTTQDLYTMFISQFQPVPTNFMEFLNSWLYDTGNPLVTLQREYDTVILIQESATKMQTPELYEVNSRTIPISHQSQSQPKFNPVNPGPVWLQANEESTQLGIHPANEWVVINVDGKGPYQTNYDGDSWVSIGNALMVNVSILSSSTRAKLVKDAFAMAKAGKANYANILYFLTYLNGETELSPWIAAINGFREMWSWIYHTPEDLLLKEYFEEYMDDRLTNIFNTLGTDQKNISDRVNGMLRREIVSILCDIDNQACIENTQRLYDSMNNTSASYKPTSDMYSVIYCSGLRSLKTQESWLKSYQNLYESIKTTVGDDIVESHLNILACPQPIGNSSDAIQAYLDVIFLKTKELPNAMVPAAFAAITSRPEHVNQALTYLVGNQSQIKLDLPTKLELLKQIQESLSSEKHIQMLTEFLQNHKDESKELLNAVNDSLLMAQRKHAFINEYTEDVKLGLLGRLSDSTSEGPEGTVSQTLPYVLVSTTSKPSPNATTTRDPGSSTASSGGPSDSTATPPSSTTPGGAATISFSFMLIPFMYFVQTLV